MTWNDAAGKWQAIDNHPIFADQKLLGAIYHAHMARGARELGYDIDRPGENGTFELAGISPREIDEFSPRSRKQIEAELAARGLTRADASAAQKQAANLGTRTAKSKDIDHEALHSLWREKYASLQQELGKENSPLPQARAVAQDPMAAREGIESALRHFTERNALVQERDVQRYALAIAGGRYGFDDVRATMDRMRDNGEIIFGRLEKQPAAGGKTVSRFIEGEATDKMLAYVEQLAKDRGIEPPAGKDFKAIREWLDTNSPKELGYEKKKLEYTEASLVQSGDVVLTTRAAQDREHVMLSRVRDGKGAMRAILAPQQARDRLEARDNADRRTAYTAAIQNGKSEAEAVNLASKVGLNPGQRQAAEMILSSRDRVVAIQGVAGAGKTYMLDRVVKEAVIAEAQAQGIQVVGLAPSHQAKNELRAVTGAGDTLQKFLTNPKEWKNYGPQHLFIVDEAGLASTKQMSELIRVSHEQGFRLALVGDSRQYPGVEAGSPFAQIQKVAETAVMQESIRHKNENLKEAAKAAAQGRVTESLQRLEQNVAVIKDADARHVAIADRYMGLTEAERAETLILTGTNEARERINEEIRSRMGLKGQGREIDVLEVKDLTAEQRRFLDAYKPGDLVEFHKAYDSLKVKSGDRLTVAEVAGDRVILANQAGERIDFHPTRINTDKISVYEQHRREFSAGDAIRFRENNKEAGYFNGDKGKVVGVKDGQIIIQDAKGREIQLNTGQPVKIDHNYAMTGYSAQGATVDRVIADFDTRSRTTSTEAFYTNITRARHEVEIYTDDGKKLPDAISRGIEKHNALDIGHGSSSAGASHQPAGAESSGAGLEI